MQATQPNSGTPQATTDSNIKRYKVSEMFGEFEVTLEVDHNILTPEIAQMINEFWTSHADRLSEEDGDHVRTVIRMFGAEAAGMILADGWGGASFGTRNIEAGGIWSEKFREQEGWGGESDTKFGRCGIRIVGAEVQIPMFNDFQVEEVPNA